MRGHRHTVERKSWGAGSHSCDAVRREAEQAHLTSVHENNDSDEGQHL